MILLLIFFIPLNSSDASDFSRQNSAPTRDRVATDEEIQLLQKLEFMNAQVKRAQKKTLPKHTEVASDVVATPAMNVTDHHPPSSAEKIIAIRLQVTNLKTKLDQLMRLTDQEDTNVFPLFFAEIKRRANAITTDHDEAEISYLALQIEILYHGFSTRLYDAEQQIAQECSDLRSKLSSIILLVSAGQGSRIKESDQLLTKDNTILTKKQRDILIRRIQYYQDILEEK